jgi:diguanylate cyclase (GGDEF)-like protein
VTAMNLDIQTLTLAGAVVALFSGLLLAGAWSTIARAPALLWWSAANLVNAAGIAMIAFGHATQSPSTAIAGIGFVIASPPLVWAGTRRFASRGVRLWLSFAGVGAWVIVGAAPLPGGQLFPTAFGFALSTIYLSASIYELWRGRGEALPARWALIAMLAIHAAITFGGVVDTFTGRFRQGALPALDSWFGLITFESLLYSMATAVFMVLLCKERSERQIVLASHKDSLTGIANRGALLDSGERLLRRCQTSGKSFSLIMFDLDHFKRINDSFGHAAGDEVIRAFASAAQSILRPNDLFGRYGGEEFVVVLPGATIEAAYVIADRIRNGFAGARVIRDTPVSCTVSAGVASAGSADATLEEIINVADDCLYRAKANGRNRVERPARMIEEPATDSVIRVA